MTNRQIVALYNQRAGMATAGGFPVAQTDFIEDRVQEHIRECGPEDLLKVVRYALEIEGHQNHANKIGGMVRGLK